MQIHLLFWAGIIIGPILAIASGLIPSKELGSYFIK